MRLAPELWNRPIGRGVFGPLVFRDRAPLAVGSDRLPLSPGEYEAWIRRFDRLTAADRRAIRLHIQSFVRKPVISVLLLHNGHNAALSRTVESLQRQLYPHWELLVVPRTESHRQRVSQALDAMGTRDRRVKCALVTPQVGSTVRLNAAAALAVGDYLTVVEHGDALSEHALYWIALEADRHPDAAVIYGDHDETDDQGRRSNPRFKPDWDPDFALSTNYLARPTVFATAFLRSFGGFGTQNTGDCAFDLVRRCALAQPNAQVRHIPAVLYHAAENSDCDPAQCPTGNRHPYRPLLEPAPRVSIIVPTRDGGEVLCRCIESILSGTTYPDYELLIVDNQSKDPGTRDYLHDLDKDRRIQILYHDAPFNYSAINNHAVRRATGELLALVNDDVEVISPDWLQEMVSLAVRPEVGAVGAKLYFPNGSLQHGGIITGLGGVARHSHKGAAAEAPGYLGCLKSVHSVSAVTGACLVVRKALYDEVGGLDADNLPIAFNDVDFCLRLMEAGYRTLWTPFAELYHIESASRGYDDTAARRRRLAREARYFKSRWRDRLENDSAYNLNLSLLGDGFALAWPPRTERPWAAGLECETRTFPEGTGQSWRLWRIISNHLSG